MDPTNIPALAWRISQYMQADNLTAAQLRRYAFVLENVTKSSGPDWLLARAEMNFEGLQELAPALAADLLAMCKANH